MPPPQEIEQLLELEPSCEEALRTILGDFSFDAAIKQLTPEQQYKMAQMFSMNYIQVVSNKDIPGIMNFPSSNQLQKHRVVAPIPSHVEIMPQQCIAELSAKLAVTLRKWCKVMNLGDATQNMNDE